MEQPETEARDPGNYYHQNLRRMGFQEKSRIYNNAQEHCWEKLIEFAFQIVISSLPHFIWQQCYPFSCSTKKHEAILDLWRSLSQDTYPIHQEILFAWVSKCICTWTTSYHYSKMQTVYPPNSKSSNTGYSALLSSHRTSSLQHTR